MVPEEKSLIPARAFICSLVLLVFAFFVSYDFPLKLISFVALLIASYLIGRSVKTAAGVRQITGDLPTLYRTTLYLFIGIATGIAVAFFYRWHLEMPFLPRSIHRFALPAAMIGATEELIFRGYIQGTSEKSDPFFSVLFSTISHTGYKCFLFISPAALSDIDIGFLALWTFLAGLIFGFLRLRSKSVLPSLIAHSTFDIIVYAELSSAPWWVW